MFFLVPFCPLPLTFFFLLSKILTFLKKLEWSEAKNFFIVKFFSYLTLSEIRPCSWCSFKLSEAKPWGEALTVLALCISWNEVLCKNPQPLIAPLGGLGGLLFWGLLHNALSRSTQHNLNSPPRGVGGVLYDRFLVATPPREVLGTLPQMAWTTHPWEKKREACFLAGFFSQGCWRESHLIASYNC